VTEVLFAIAITGVIFVSAGVPFALSVRSRSEGWASLAVDSLGFGIVVVPLIVVAWTLASGWGIAVAAAVFLGFITLAIRSQVGLPTIPTRPPLSLALTWAAVVVAGLVVRLHDVNFLPWVGDMGAYVNWSNEFVRTGELAAAWPPLYSSFLAVSTAIFGPSGTTSGIAMTGIVLIAVTTRLLMLLALNRWVVVGIAAALTFNVHAIWYSTFPSSESLNAPIFVVWALMLVVVQRTTRQQLPAAIGLTFLVMLNLCLLRGSGIFLLAPALLLAIVSIALPAWRAWGFRIWSFFLASLVAAQVGVWYGVSVIPRYFVDMQLRMIAPQSIFDWGKSIDLFSPGPLLLGVLIVMAVLAALGLAFAYRHSDPDEVAGARATRILALIAALVLALGIALEGVVGANVWLIFVRSGLWLVALPVIALVLMSRREKVRDDVPVTFLLVATSLILIGFHTQRLGNDRIHPFFLYWDRYLFSEIIPGLAIVAAIGANAIVLWAVSRGSLVERRTSRYVPVGVTALLLGALIVPHTPTIARMSEDTYMAGAFSFTTDLAAAVDPESTNFWGATSADPAPGFFFPNTWMAFAVPLNRSFGYEFQNVSQGEYNFAPDKVVSPLEIERALKKADRVFVFETQTGEGASLDERMPAWFSVTKVVEETSDISLLAQERTLAGWTHAQINVIVWEITRK
jgi:hypothetical protein